MLVIGRDDLDRAERVALDRFQSIWQPDGKPDLAFVPVKWGDHDTLLKRSRVFINATPFVPPRHHRKGRGDFWSRLKTEVGREAKDHGLPAPERVIPMQAVPGRMREIRWLEFRRNRKGDDEKAGYGFRLEFKEPVPGPFAIGYGAHFGLGLFILVNED